MSNRARREYVLKAERAFVDCISKCSKNIILGHVTLKPRQMRALRRRRQDLRSVASKRTSLKRKKQIIQKGGFLSALIPPVVTFLTSYLLPKLFGH